MSKRTLQKAMTLALLPLSFGVFASVSAITTEMQLETDFDTRSGNVVTQTYFYNGQWYLKAVETDNLFGEIQRVILKGETPIDSKEKLKQRIKDDALFIRNNSEESEHIISKDMEIKYSSLEKSKSLAICIKNKKADYYGLVKNEDSDCDFTVPDKDDFVQANYNTGMMINTMKAGMSYNEIEFLVSEHQELPLKSLGINDYTSVAVKGNMIFLK